MSDYGAYPEKLKKGDLGEDFIVEIIKAANYNVEMSDHKQAHKFDGYVLRGDERCLLFDVKVKPRRYKYPDQGIDLCHWTIYMRESELHQLPFALFILDETTECWYWELLHNLEKPYFDIENKIQYPWNQTNRYGTTLRYYHLNQFPQKHWHALPQDLIEQFRKLNVSKFKNKC